MTLKNIKKDKSKLATISMAELLHSDRAFFASGDRGSFGGPAL